MPDGMEEPISLRGPSAFISLIQLMLEIRERLLLAHIRGEGSAQEVDVFESLQLGNAHAKHHREQRDEEFRVLVQ